MPIGADEEWNRMQDNSEALADRGEWHLDICSTYHRRIKKKPSPRCRVSTEDVEKHFKDVGEPVQTPEDMHATPKKDSGWFVQPPMEKTLSLEGDFAE
jgi:hypothetical protein